MYTIRRLTAEELPAAARSLGELLVDAVDGGSSLGFLAPLGLPAATDWWQALAPDLAAGRLVLWVALAQDGQVAGTVQLRPAGSANGRHRAEMAKLMVHRAARGRRLATYLLAAAELNAADLGISLLVLDTETGSPAEHLYASAGWSRAGVIPDYAADPAGALHPTTLFYKPVGPRPA
jgi:GNAT superfamily N-acetyltransferase